MNTSIEIVLLILGAIFLLLGLTGEIKFKEINLGTPKTPLRITLAVVGAIFILLSFFHGKVINLSPSATSEGGLPYTHEIYNESAGGINLRTKPYTDIESKKELEPTYVCWLKNGHKVIVINEESSYKCFKIITRNKNGKVITGYIAGFFGNRRTLRELPNN